MRRIFLPSLVMRGSVFIENFPPSSLLQIREKKRGERQALALSGTANWRQIGVINLCDVWMNGLTKRRKV
jgi:hypothetical protein